jgi:hypothetical protein
LVAKLESLEWDGGQKLVVIQFGVQNKWTVHGKAKVVEDAAGRP